MNDEEHLAKLIIPSMPGFIDYKTTHDTVIAMLQKHKSMYEKFIKQNNIMHQREITKKKTEYAIGLIEHAIHNPNSLLYTLLTDKVNLYKLDQML